MKVLQAETSGFADKTFSPRLRETARSLLKFYFLITLACVVSYWLAGMSWFEAFCHSFSTVSIGGFSIYNENFGYFNNQTIELVAVVFMMISATNFGLHFLSFTKASFRYYLRNDELKFFLVVVLFAVFVSVLTLYVKEGFSFDSALRYGVFQTISIVTTTGFTLEPLTALGSSVGFLIFIIAFIGACSGSVGGGMKAWRVLLMLKVGFSNMTKIMHPNAVSSVKLNGEKVVSSQIEAVFSFIAIYITFFLFFLFVLVFQDVDFYSAFSGTAAAINNLGPGLGDLSENYSSLTSGGKLALTMAMIVGRLELFGVLILMIPSFWKN
jgi:trk system potassium uptake protein TrkH